MSSRPKFCDFHTSNCAEARARIPVTDIGYCDNFALQFWAWTQSSYHLVVTIIALVVTIIALVTVSCLGPEIYRYAGKFVG